MKSIKYSIENLNIRCSAEEFELEVERNIEEFKRHIPKTDPNYFQRLIQSAIECAISTLDPTSFYNMLSAGGIKDGYSKVDSEC